MSSISHLLSLAFCSVILFWSAQAAAFCGMYVSKEEDAKLLNEATQVVLFRDGLTTAVTMQNSYKGPAEDFAMLVPVPQVLQQEHVETISPDAMTRLATFTSPRLSAYEKRVRCNKERRRSKKFSSGDIDNLLGAEESGSGSGDSSGAEGFVLVKSSFYKGEYEIKTLEASDSTGLLEWLKSNEYNIPAGGEELLQGYINAGMYFFVAKVNASKVKFDKAGRAELSPLRFTYSSEDFALPVRLGMVNADGPQDLLIHTLSPQGRYESSNHLTGIMPTNLIVQSKVQKNFASFYSSLYQRTRQKQEATLMTEFVGISRARQKCDPCTSEDLFLTEDMLTPFVSFGADTYDTRHDIHVRVGSGSRPFRNVIRRELISRLQTHCFNEKHLPLENVSRMNALQHLTLQTNSETNALTWTLGELEGFDALSADEVVAFEGCVKAVLDKFDTSHVARQDKILTHSVRVNYSFQRDRTFNAEQRDVLLRLIVSRMRGTFTPKETTEDIVFALADVLIGGFGAPKLEDDSMLSFYEESERGINRFQARYIIIDSDIDDQIKKCSKVLGWSVHWTNPSPGAFDARPMSMTEKPKFSIKQLRRLIKNEKQAKLDL